MDIANYINLAKACESILKEETEWIFRYSKYIDKILGAKELVINSQKLFSIPDPLKLYLPLGRLTKGKQNEIEYDLRYQGQSVGSLIVRPKDPKGEQVFLKNNEESHLLTEEFLKANCDCKDLLNWQSSNEAKAFRKFYKNVAAKDNCGQPEHRLESYLLSNYSKKSSDGKELLHIQPIGMLGTTAKFQMPTPFKGSILHNSKTDITKDSVYSGYKGGGIDILARTGKGRNTYLSVIELKDENRTNESPQDAIRQAIAYTVFIRELLRSKDAGNLDWWHFFGFSGNKIPDKLILRAVIAMPFDGTPKAEDNAKRFMEFVNAAKPKIIMNNKDTIELHYIFRHGTKPETSIIETSLK